MLKNHKIYPMTAHVLNSWDWSQDISCSKIKKFITWQLMCETHEIDHRTSHAQIIRFITWQLMAESFNLPHDCWSHIGLTRVFTWLLVLGTHHICHIAAYTQKIEHMASHDGIVRSVIWQLLSKTHQIWDITNVKPIRLIKWPLILDSKRLITGHLMLVHQICHVTAVLRLDTLILDSPVTSCQCYKTFNSTPTYSCSGITEGKNKIYSGLGKLHPT
jgi:hypothetical protein